MEQVVNPRCNDTECGGRHSVDTAARSKVCTDASVGKHCLVVEPGRVHIRVVVSHWLHEQSRRVAVAIFSRVAPVCVSPET